MAEVLKQIIREATLYCGDCADIIPKLGVVSAVVTDPPYGIGYASNPIVGKGKKESNHSKMFWDNATPNIGPLLEIGKAQIIWGGNYFPLPPSRCWLVWHKPDAPPSMANIELAWTNMDRTAKQITHSIAATNAERCGHPTQKPVRVMQWCIDQLPEGCHTILDPYMGSGTTGVACAKMGRRFIGIEREPKYFEIACRRIADAYDQPDLFVMPSIPQPAKPADLFSFPAA